MARTRTFSASSITVLSPEEVDAPKFKKAREKLNLNKQNGFDHAPQVHDNDLSGFVTYIERSYKPATRLPLTTPSELALIPFLGCYGSSTCSAVFFQNRSTARPSYTIAGNKVPSVDIFITFCGEDVEVAMDTISAAFFQDYPKDSFRVFVMDDGNMEELRKAVECFNKLQKSKNRKPAIYLARRAQMKNPKHYKAGNIHFGISESAKLGGSDLIAGLDADMIVSEDWLRRTIPHLVLEPDVALVNPPQHFYNVPEGDPLGQDSGVFSDVQEPLNDGMIGSQCSGSGYVARRKAIDDIGGWPLVNIGEDIYCSYLLAGKGWKVAYINEKTQFGLAPSSLAAYIKQRIRWTDGSLMVFKDFGFFIPGLDPTTDRGPAQKLGGLMHALETYSNLAVVFGAMLLPTSILTTAWFNAEQSTYLSPQYSWLGRLFLLSHIATKLNTVSVFGRIGLGNLSRQRATRFWGAPYNCYCIFKQFLPRRVLHFEVTGSVVSRANEQSERHRQPLPGRMMSAHMLMHIACVVYAVSALVIFFGLSASKLSRGSHLGIFFPYPACILRLIDSYKKGAVPVWYMLFPPTVPARRELLQRDSNGVYRPRRMKKLGGVNIVSWTDVIEVAIILCYGCF